MEPRAACPACGSSRFVYDDTQGEIVCAECGCVLPHRFYYDHAYWGREPEERKHSGPAVHPWSPDKGIITVVSAGGRWRRLSRLQASVISHRSFANVVQEVRRLASSLPVPVPSVVVQDALLLASRAARKGVLRGAKVHAFAAACLFIATRRNGVLVRWRDITAASPVDEKRIRAAAHAISKTLGISYADRKAEEWVPLLVYRAGVNPDLIQASRAVLSLARQNPAIVSGRDPLYVAAGAIAYVCRIAGLEKDAEALRETVSDLGMKWSTVRHFSCSLEELFAAGDGERDGNRWLFVADEKNYRTACTVLLWGFSSAFAARVPRLLASVKPGDSVVFYVKGCGFAGLYTALTGVVRVRDGSGVFTPSGVHREDEKFPFRLALWPLVAADGYVPPTPGLLEALSFVKTKRLWPLYFRYSLRPLPPEDFTILAHAISGNAR